MFVKRLVLPCLTALILSGPFAASVHAQAAPEPLWTHAFDLACRELGMGEFDKAKKFGIEAFKDVNNKMGLYISQVGSLAATNSGFQNVLKPFSPSLKPEFITGWDLQTRKAGQSWDTAVTHSMEIFRDGNTGNWIYITEKGYVAATPAKGGKISGEKKIGRSHAIDLEVRKGGEKSWKNAQKYGIEVYSDPSTGNLIYICETGSLAVIAEDPAAKVTGDAKAFDHLHGLDLKSRRFDEYQFGKGTKKVGVELYRDNNNGNLIYLTEVGTLTVTPGPKGLKAPTEAPTDPKWAHAFNLRCRKVGEELFSNDTRAFGVEVFRDDNVGVILYLAETGSLAGVKAP